MAPSRPTSPIIRYFAYGSNMASAEMEAWCRGHRFLGAARLDGHRLELRRRSTRWRGGTADIVPAPGDAVWGALYELPDAALRALDRKEGEGFAYRRSVVALDVRGERCTAVAYAVIDKEPREVPCVPEYRALLLGAARERGLPEVYIRELERRLVVAATPASQRERGGE